MNNITYAGKNLITFSVHWHSHNDWELVYCTSGEGEFEFSDRTVRYSAGDVVVIPPNTRHMNNSDKGFTNIHINIADAMIGVSLPLLISDDNERHILTAFNDAFFFFNSQTDNKELIVAAFGNLIVNYVVAFRNARPLRNVINAIKTDIMQNFTNCDYELDEFLRTIPFSYDYLRKLFKSEMGMTPHAYLTGLRMQMAEKLLCSAQNTEQNVSQIAYVCGYAEPLYFSRVFKKHFGCSPKNYAQKNRKKQPEDNIE